MKSKFISVIMAIIVLLIICVLCIFGMIFWEEIKSFETGIIPEDFQTVISDTYNTIDTNLETPEIIENSLDLMEDKDTSNNSIDYSSVTIDRYFYNQLSSQSQIIYKAFEANKENLKTGNYEIKLGDSFTNILSKENGQEELGQYYQTAFEAFNYDNPDVFYLNPNKMYLNIETTTSISGKKYNVYINSGNKGSYLTDEFSSEVEVNNAINEVEQIKKQIVSNRTQNAYENIKMVHDYLVNNLEYDTSISKPHIYTIYGALVNRVCVCEGYARAFKYIMDELKIPCVLVIGKGTNSQGQTENHAWNYVQLNGKWYAIDTTWDDPVIYGNGKISRESKYKYFLKGSKNFNQDHSPSGQFTQNGKVFNYPEISNSDYN